MRTAGVAVGFIILMPFLLPYTNALNQECFNDCISQTLCEAPRISQCVQRCRSKCGGAEELALNASDDCKLGCSTNLCSKFDSDSKEHRACSDKCSKKYCNP